MTEPRATTKGNDMATEDSMTDNPAETLAIRECKATLANCVCSLAEGHDGPHDCDGVSALEPTTRCMGQWEGDGESPKLVRYPTGAMTAREAMNDAVLSNYGLRDELRARVISRAEALGKLVAPAEVSA